MISVYAAQLIATVLERLGETSLEIDVEKLVPIERMTVTIQDGKLLVRVAPVPSDEPKLPLEAN